MTIETPAAVAAAEQEVLTAAGWVVNSYRARGGYTVPLSFNLHSLAAAVDAWRSAMHQASLDSDTNGFDRSSIDAGEGGHSNEQSCKEPEAQRRGCAAAQAERSVRREAAS